MKQPKRSLKLAWLSVILTASTAFSCGPALSQGFSLPIPRLPLSNLFSSPMSDMSGGQMSPQQAAARSGAIKAYNRGYHFAKDENWAAAADAYREAVQLDPTMGEAHVSLGLALLRGQNYEQALPELETGSKMKPDDKNVWMMLGEASSRLQKYQTSLYAFRQYLQLFPNGPYAQHAQESVSILEHTYFANPQSAEDNGNYLADFATEKGLKKWNSNVLPLRIFINSDPRVTGYDPAFDPILRQSFNDWTVVTNGQIQFIMVDDPSKAQITCRWTADRKELGGTQELGVTWTRYDRRTGEIVHADMIFLTVFDQGQARRDDIYKRCKNIDLHEIGHALGLSHSKEPYDIMFPQVAPGGLEHPLTCRDRNTLLALYNTNGVSNMISQRFGASMRSVAQAQTMLPGPNPFNLVDRLAFLNHQANEANAARNFDLAIEKLEEARNLSPNDRIITRNLGLAYSNAAVMAEQSGNCLKAARCYQSAADVLKASPNQDDYVNVLANYQAMLQRQSLQPRTN